MNKRFISTALLLLSVQNLFASNNASFYLDGDQNKPVSGGGALLFKSYFEDHPDGRGEDLCLLVGHEKNLGYWSLPAGGAEQKDGNIYGTMKRETLEETGGVVDLSGGEPTLYSRKFQRAFAVVADDTLGCNQLTKAVTTAINNPALGAAWKEMDRYTAISVSEIIKTAQTIRTHWEKVAPNYINKKTNQPCNYNTLWHHHATHDLPPEVSPADTPKGTTITLTTRNGQKIPFSAFYFGSIVDKLVDFKKYAQATRLPHGFLPKTYLNINLDLTILIQGKNSSDIDGILANHYRTHGKNEQRVFAMPRNFEPSIYIDLHLDVKSATVGLPQKDALAFAEHHFIKYGLKEKRSYGVPKSFDHKIYFALNQDVEKAFSALSAKKQALEARKHFHFHGKSEGRLYKLPSHFDPSIYLDLHKDLAQHVAQNALPANDARTFAQMHYARHGMKEGRSYGVPADFNISQYFALNADLAAHVEGMTDREKNAFARRHFVFYGAQENRRYK
ncbi:MAG: NUDIX hydrolase [Alphaproteobacteria bacterium]|nr:NUDIX hydrolase [Alphaproteobacteria bacterium]